MTENVGLTLTPAKLGFVLALFSAITVGWNAVGYLKEQELKDFSQDQRLVIIERSAEKFEQSLDRLYTETKELRVAVVRLTTVMESQASYSTPKSSRLKPNVETVTNETIKIQ